MCHCIVNLLFHENKFMKLEKTNVARKFLDPIQLFSHIPYILLLAMKLKNKFKG